MLFVGSGEVEFVLVARESGGFTDRATVDQKLPCVFHSYVDYVFLDSYSVALFEDSVKVGALVAEASSDALRGYVHHIIISDVFADCGEGIE